MCESFFFLFFFLYGFLEGCFVFGFQWYTSVTSLFLKVNKR